MLLLSRSKIETVEELRIDQFEEHEKNITCQIKPLLNGDSGEVL